MLATNLSRSLMAKQDLREAQKLKRKEAKNTKNIDKYVVVKDAGAVPIEMINKLNGGK